MFRTVAAAILAGFLAYVAFRFHLNLSSVGSLELLLVVMTALRWGFTEATAASLVAATGLNFLFIPPLFRLTVADPANWVSLATFEITAVLVSRLSTSVRVHAIEAESQRSRALRLYEFSRAILLINGGSRVQEQLCTLIQEIIQVEDVQIVLFPRRSSDAHTPRGTTAIPVAEQQASHLGDSMDYVGKVARRTLRVGTTPIGMLILNGWENESSIADAVASLSAIAIERARAVQEESRAEGERDTEKLRTAVLDGLAHSFKTPLTAILTASSGLLAIGGTNATQTELITLVDEQATYLNTLTTKLLKTASLEGRQVRLRKTQQSLVALIHHVIELCDPASRSRIRLHAGPEVDCCQVDSELITLAIAQLVDNAIKYSDLGTEITISMTQDQRELTITVENLGIPILKDETEKIFERFYRGSNAIGGPAGTGLGLSIVSKAAAAHQGRVSVHTEDRTIRFNLTIPN
ncbi:MAG: sensor histidine kinase [Janthinobacterium lividum]